MNPVTPPGITILENIRALSMNQQELAERMGRPLKTVNEIIKGKTALTPETALQLERVIGVPADFWLAREARYREYLERKREERFLHEALLEALNIPCQLYHERNFKDILRKIREMTKEVPEEFGPRVQTLYANAGVAVVFIRELRGTGASGVTRRLAPDKAILQVSSRFNYFLKCSLKPIKDVVVSVNFF